MIYNAVWRRLPGNNFDKEQVRVQLQLLDANFDVVTVGPYMEQLAGLPGFARDSCSIIMFICAFHFYIIYFHFFSAEIMAFLKLLITFWPPKPQNYSPGIEGLFIFSLCPFPYESADVYQIGRFSRLLNFWPLKPPQNAPWCIEGLIVFSLFHSADVYQIRSSCLVDFLDFCIFYPLNPPQFPLGYRGANCF